MAFPKNRCIRIRDGAFAPGRADWKPQDLIMTDGNHDTLAVGTFLGGGRVDQHDYAAFVLINPAADASPLELAAAVVPEQPRHVTLLDSDGKPVVGARMDGLTYNLRAATVPIWGLHPDRARKICFVQKDRKRIGLVAATAAAHPPSRTRRSPHARSILPPTGSMASFRRRPPRRPRAGQSPPLLFDPASVFPRQSAQPDSSSRNSCPDLRNP
jgi:hypothetical protein